MQKLFVNQSELELIQSLKPASITQEIFDKWVEDTFEEVIPWENIDLDRIRQFSTYVTNKPKGPS